VRQIRRLTQIALPALALLVFTALPAMAGADGEALYNQHCSTCHGKDGKADTPVGKALHAAHLVDPKYASEESDAGVTHAIRTLPKHKSVSGQVSDDDLKAIAAYIRKLAAAASPAH
jgi:mono/diheme cytochrome c family protein